MQNKCPENLQAICSPLGERVARPGGRAHLVRRGPSLRHELRLHEPHHVRLSQRELQTGKPVFF